jgi:hypothetical protein
MPTAPPTLRLPSIVEASAMLDPYVKPTNATNWLADMLATQNEQPKQVE